MARHTSRETGRRTERVRERERERESDRRARDRERESEREREREPAALTLCLLCLQRRCSAGQVLAVFLAQLVAMLHLLK
jgi:hypothetical protein